MMMMMIIIIIKVIYCLTYNMLEEWPSITESLILIIVGWRWIFAAINRLCRATCTQCCVTATKQQPRLQWFVGLLQCFKLIVRIFLLYFSKSPNLLSVTVARVISGANFVVKCQKWNKVYALIWRWRSPYVFASLSHFFHLRAVITKFKRFQVFFTQSNSQSSTHD